MQSKKSPKITVIIPTRERADVLLASMKTAVAQDYDNLEILVSDNFSEDDTAEVVHSFNDSRIRYLNTGRRLSMSHNWEFALSHVEDGWVTILGDDDGLLPGAVSKVSEVAAKYGVSAVRSLTCKYRWPANDGTGARLSIPMERGVEMRDSKAWLQKALRGRATYMDLPMLYTGGFVNMQLMHEIKSRTGAFYSSCNPDVFSGIAVASVTKSYLYLREPIAIAGISRHSIGTSHFSRPLSDEAISPAQRFIAEANIPFHPDIPVCADGIIPRSAQIILFESYLQSAFLRNPVTHDLYAKQLEIVAAGRSGKDSDLDKWLIDYSSLHRIDLRSALRRAVILRTRNAIIKLPHSLRRRWSTCRIRGNREDIRDVYLASIFAADFLSQLYSK